MRRNDAEHNESLRAHVRSLVTEVLATTNISDDENFFDAGATSLDIIRLATRLREDGFQDVRAVTVYRRATISQLTEALAQSA